ncbi:MAG: rhamnan synthesis F family protein [Bacteroidota bacterium]|nr:rhamnan synthesis F family protein [Bacteroidota bacterium]MDP4215175.1 rhamnan synthesis F family protein [Bacteroidota bacterium]MDP4246710.1 rhamnan synthesis F family protein [Bacteroidota bacterium]MDP4252674.1 rhamnan synthesis F family protein [Bacteroidota bacterium]MDP4256697.1 rhamnan synthesis F family protein [Bacteroidota bacterium]
MRSDGDLTLILHLYYPGSWETVRSKCSFVLGQATRTIITACHDDVIQEIQPQPNMVILKVTNKGKDVGGKLAALSYYLCYCKRTEYLVFLHDKISPQTINADYWMDTLYRIFEQEVFERAIRTLKKYKSAGIVGSRPFLKTEYLPSERRFDSTNDNVLKQLIDRHGLRCKEFRFIAGTIFIAKSRIYEDFFTLHPPLDARRDLEEENVLDLTLGTYTHSWERLFCFIAEDSGYTVTGI